MERVGCRPLAPFQIGPILTFFVTGRRAVMHCLPERDIPLFETLGARAPHNVSLVREDEVIEGSHNTRHYCHE